jgi:hypothetical protein
MKQLRQKARPAAKARRLCAPTRSELQHKLTEVTRHRGAISEVLRAIASSPRDLQPIFDTIVDAATNLCRADGATLRLIEKEGVRLVARKVSPAVSKWVLSPTIAERGSYLSRSVTSGRIVHVPDIPATETCRTSHSIV